MVTLITYFELQDAIIDQYQLPSALIIEKDIIYYGKIDILPYPLSQINMSKWEQKPQFLPLLNSER